MRGWGSSPSGGGVAEEEEGGWTKDSVSQSEQGLGTAWLRR